MHLCYFHTMSVLLFVKIYSYVTCTVYLNFQLLLPHPVYIYIQHCHCRLKDIHSRSDTSRTGAEGLSFYYPRLLNCLNQMLAVVLLSQHRVLSSKTIRPRAPCGVRCIEHAVSIWSVVCSEAPHSKFGEGARPHLCMDKWNCPTPVRRRLSLTQAAWDKPIPTGLVPVRGTKAQSLEAFSKHRARKHFHRAWKHFHSIFTVSVFLMMLQSIPFVICPFRSADAKSSKVVQKILHSWHKWASES